MGVTSLQNAQRSARKYISVGRLSTELTQNMIAIASNASIRLAMIKVCFLFISLPHSPLDFACHYIKGLRPRHTSGFFISTIEKDVIGLTDNTVLAGCFFPVWFGDVNAHDVEFVLVGLFEPIHDRLYTLADRSGWRVKI